VASVKSADQKKEFNFFANFVPSFPENASELYASAPEIKLLVSRKTSEKRVLFSYDFRTTPPDCGATSVGSTLNEWWVWETEGTLKAFGPMQKITRSLKNRSGEFPETATRPATPASPPVQTHRDNRPRLRGRSSCQQGVTYPLRTQRQICNCCNATPEGSPLRGRGPRAQSSSAVARRFAESDEHEWLHRMDQR
jgi:hypothetical protein